MKVLYIINYSTAFLYYLIVQPPDMYYFHIAILYNSRQLLFQPQDQITQSLLCISITGSNDLERSGTKFGLNWGYPPFLLNIKYSVPYSTQNLI